ncbi:hypothetical protein [Chryseobacterium sp. RR2-3-20]|uniref:hypothetical protein n=1 Tax=Chryseobacterium sp. RR2-3-20 TaxID=2787626 RepID=UPI001ADF8EE0|nr:hypothetical protein [Chryseobacterium sp. RR2-3-20]
MKKIFRFLQITVLMHILMSTDCGGFPENLNTQVESETKIYMNNSINFKINDTIWINGFRSMKNYDTSISDSIIQNFTPYTNIGISKLVHNTNYNLVRAANKFEIISIQMSPEDFCENNSIRIMSSNDDLNKLFRYKIGLIPTEKGDFVISLNNKFLFQNINKRNDILVDYPINDPYKMVWEICNQTVPRRDLLKGDIFVKIIE